MIGFFFKKAFFDGWDHLFALFLLNLGFCGIIVLGLAVGPLIKSAVFFNVFISFLIFFIGFWFSVSSFALNRDADYGSFGFKELPGIMKAALLPGLEYGLVMNFVYYAVTVGLPFYFSVGKFISYLAAGILIWVSLFALVAMQWFLPVQARMGGGFRKAFKKSFLLFADNPGFSFSLALYNLVSLALSLFLALLMPGFAGVALASDDALRLRMYKYDWLEQHPGLDARARKDIPWDELLAEDRELVGKRTLKGMIFPWKE